MGLDITIREHIGFTDSGYLKMRAVPEKLDYSTERLVVRHEISKNVKFKVLSSGKDQDIEEYYRPEDFDAAYVWANKLDGKDREFVVKLFDALFLNENYWLDYGY